MLESSEDYELVLLRLCAGEGGLVRTEPEEARARFAEELQSPNPDLRRAAPGSSTCWSRSAREPLARALDPEPDPRPAVRAALRRPSRCAGLDLPALDPLDDLDPIEPRRPRRRARATRRRRRRRAPHCLYCGDSLPGRPAGAVLPALRAAAGAVRVPPVPQRGRARAGATA